MSESASLKETPGKRSSSRRDFLRVSAAGLAVPIAGVAFASCSTGSAESAAGAAVEAEEAGTGGEPAPSPPPGKSARELADEMDLMHEAGVKSFPAKTAGKGNQILEPRIERGVKVFELTAAKIQWEAEVRKFVEAWAYNGQVPGIQIRVREGDKV